MTQVSWIVGKGRKVEKVKFYQRERDRETGRQGERERKRKEKERK